MFGECLTSEDLDLYYDETPSHVLDTMERFHRSVIIIISTNFNNRAFACLECNFMTFKLFIAFLINLWLCFASQSLSRLRFHHIRVRFHHFQLLIAFLFIQWPLLYLSRVRFHHFQLLIVYCFYYQLMAIVLLISIAVSRPSTVNCISYQILPILVRH